jgi:hypothetical protein
MELLQSFLQHQLELALFTLQGGARKGKVMMKTVEIIGEAVRNPKYPFRKTEHQPKKARKHRYERRKIREYLHLGDWLAEEMA